MAKHSERLRDLEEYPKYKRNFIKSFEKLYHNRKANPKKDGTSSVDRWESGEAMFEWWVKEDMKKSDEAPELFRFDD